MIVGEFHYSIRTLPLSLKALLTVFLLFIGLGYAMSLMYMFLLDVDDGANLDMKSAVELIQKQYGPQRTNPLEASLAGTMRDFVSTEHRERINEWIRNGATEESFKNVEPILASSCVSCHSPEGEQDPMLTSFEEVKATTKTDLSGRVLQLAKVSHVHLFGLTFIFFLTGVIFSLCELRESIKIAVVCLPFIAMFLDIGSWWLILYQEKFAYTLLFGGALISLVVPIQVILPIYQMWFVRSSDRA